MLEFDGFHAGLCRSAVEPAVAVWVGLLNMTVIPLVVSLLITSTNSASASGKLGQIAGKLC